MNRFAVTVFLLCCSNIFMTFAWYGHLRNHAHKPWIIAALISWGIALFEYLLQVPANRVGHEIMPVGPHGRCTVDSVLIPPLVRSQPDASPHRWREANRTSALICSAGG